METVTGPCHLMPDWNSFFKTIGISALVFLFCTWPTVAGAQEVLLGTVVSVDRDKGTFVLQLEDSTEDAPLLVTIESGTAKEAPVLPSCVETGEFVRVWGQYAGESTGLFRANVVRGPGMSHQDRSGVRSRLTRGQGNQSGRPSGRQSGRSRGRH